MADENFVIINPWTKEVSNPVDTDFCDDSRIIPAVN